MPEITPPTFRVDKYRGADDVMVSAHGDLDLASVPLLEEVLQRALKEGLHRDVIVDLAGVQVVDATGVSVLFKWSQRLSAQGLDLVLSAPSPDALAALRGSGLYEMFTVTRT
jgi:anti-anti-sigma factor